MGRFNKTAGRVLVVVIAVAVLAAVTPIFFFDQFKIHGESMSPTLESGDHILVNKLLMGARIYRKYDFSDSKLDCFRMPGLRKAEIGDIVVFNYPKGRGRGRIEFKINYVYAKRCVGCPGDTVRIVDGYYRNHRALKMEICPEPGQEFLSSNSDSVLFNMGICVNAMPFSKKMGWTIRNFGPLYVPRKGAKILLTPASLLLYGREIEFETGSFPEVLDDRIYLNGHEISEYEFTSDWYFFSGDNVLNSKDSRYIGLVPEDYIVGIATRLLFSEKGDRMNNFMKRL